MGGVRHEKSAPASWPMDDAGALAVLIIVPSGGLQAAYFSRMNTLIGVPQKSQCSRILFSR